MWDPAAAPGGVEVARPPPGPSKYKAGTRVAQDFAELEAEVAGETTSEASYSKATGIIDGLTREEVKELQEVLVILARIGHIRYA